MLNYCSPALIVVIITIVITLASPRAFLKFTIAQFAHRYRITKVKKRNCQNMYTLINVLVLINVFSFAKNE